MRPVVLIAVVVVGVPHLGVPQRKGGETWGGGQHSTQGLQMPKYVCQIAQSFTLKQHWELAGL